MNSINSMSSAMGVGLGSMQKQPPPSDKDAFRAADSDANGLVSSTELEAVIEGIAEVTGTTMDVEETLGTYDIDLDGYLSGEEMLKMLTDQGFGPPRSVDSDGGGPPPPPPPSTDQALASYEENSGGDLMTQLIDILDNSESDSDSRATLNITS